MEILLQKKNQLRADTQSDANILFIALQTSKAQRSWFANGIMINYGFMCLHHAFQLMQMFTMCTETKVTIYMLT